MSSQNPTPKPFWTATRLSLFYVAFFAVVGIHLPFWPVWLKFKGLGATEIAIVLALGTAGRIVASPLLANVADRYGERRRPMILLAFAAFLAFCLYALTDGFWAIFAVTTLFIVAWAPIMPLGETLIATTAREQGLEYGRIRLWGSLSFIAAAVLAGRELAGRPEHLVFWLLAATTALTALSCLLLPDCRVSQTDGGRPRFRQFLMDPRFVLFLLSAALVQSSHGVYYVFGTLHWKTAGYSEGIIGLLWAEGVLAEVILFAFGAFVSRHLGPARLILLGGLAGILRWTALGLSDALPVLLAVQALHAFTFGAVHLAAINFVMQTVPPAHAATAMSLYSSTTMGLAMGISMLISGPLYDAAGGQSYLAMSGLAAIGAVLAVRLARYDKADE
ncbi:MAG: 3-phenylpropionate MFS transporter [Rhodospirillales bacterium]|nr:3-phenylpropionate MFS transporter [Rhodospirillales bacterium]